MMCNDHHHHSTPIFSHHFPMPDVYEASSVKCVITPRQVFQREFCNGINGNSKCLAAKLALRRSKFRLLLVKLWTDHPGFNVYYVSLIAILLIVYPSKRPTNRFWSSKYPTKKQQEILSSSRHVPSSHSSSVIRQLSVHCQRQSSLKWCSVGQATRASLTSLKRTCN